MPAQTEHKVHEEPDDNSGSSDIHTSSPKPELKLRPLFSIVVLVVLALLVLAVGYLFLQDPARKDAVSLNTVPAIEHKASNQPVRIQIPIINVDAPIAPLGITRGGDMEAPDGPKLVGWYKFGPRPGEIGSAVVDGHFGIWKNGERSVFDNLSKLKAGDNVIITDGNNDITTFVVRESRDFDPQANTSAVFKSYDGKAHLNLITCDGAWDAVTKSYSKRLVVFADKQ